MTGRDARRGSDRVRSGTIPALFPTHRRPGAGGAALVAAVLLAGCATGAGPSEQAVTTTAAVVATTATTGFTAPEPPTLRLGEKFTTSDGNTVLVHIYQQPVPATAIEADPGNQFAAVEVEVCAGKRGIPRATADSFRLELVDGTRRGRSFFGPKEPRFADAKLPPGECARGWVNFEAPVDERPAYVVFQGSSVGRWSAGGRRR